ncbi:MAG: VTT domain-containing protein [Bacteroidales bacterium]|jgi:membrane protein DedA with SNARE-associated domain
MKAETVQFITEHGYAAVFLLVFLQEIGMPNPLPNELLLLLSGYLSYNKIFLFPMVILTAFFADFTGTNILYFTFYTAGTMLIKKIPKWFPFSRETLEHLTYKIDRGGYAAIFLLRLTPFTRGYTSVITGILRVKPGVFLPVAFLSAAIWSSAYITAGYLMGPSWNITSLSAGCVKYLILAALSAILLLIILKNFFNKVKKHKVKTAYQ